MGFYIECPQSVNKAEQIRDIFGAIILDRWMDFDEIPPGKALICVLHNGAFDAAGFVFSRSEWRRFLGPDRVHADNPALDNGIVHFVDLDPLQERERTWLLMDWDTACMAAGVTRAYLERVYGPLN